MQSLSLESNGSLGNSYLGWLFPLVHDYVRTCTYVRVCLCTPLLSLSLSFSRFSVSSPCVRTRTLANMRGSRRDFSQLDCLVHCRCDGKVSGIFFPSDFSFHSFPVLSVRRCTIKVFFRDSPVCVVMRLHSACILHKQCDRVVCDRKRAFSCRSFCGTGSCDNIGETRQGNRCCTFTTLPCDACIFLTDNGLSFAKLLPTSAIRIYFSKREIRTSNLGEVEADLLQTCA